jgi:tetratricopeptide (TPR) repeat protein
VTPRALLPLLALLLLLPAAARAQDVDVRASRGDGYTRTVFAWDGKVAYAASPLPDGAYEVAFNRPADLPAGAGFAVASTDPLRVVFRPGPGQTLRHFALGPRVFVDIVGDPAPGAAKPQPAKPEPAKPQPKPEPEPERPAPGPEPRPAPREAAPPPQPAAPLLRRAVEESGGDGAALSGPHIIGLASTTALHVAAFERAGALYLLATPVGDLLTPSVRGPPGRPSALGPLEAQDMPDAGRLWMAPVPPGAGPVRARGGGLSWEVIVAPTTPEGQAPEPEPQAADVAPRRIAGPALLWPLPADVAEALGPVMRVPDPVTGGADLFVVPLAGASHRTSAARAYPEFEVLPSAAGLVVRARVDDLTVTPGPEGVVIARPGGAAVSRPPPEPDAHGAAPEDGPAYVGAAGPFALAQWRGGPERGLAYAKTLILAGLRDLPPPARVEGILTLARMYIAHGRGSEALGLLRYAAREVPALEGTVEFRAWRAMARALEGREPGAYADLAHPGLEAFPDTGYWRAYVLAGAGDWGQAAAALPPPPGPLPAYPEPVRTRLALALAEVALRAGDITDGRAFLALAAPPNGGPLAAPLSAARDYLTGEAARQEGDARAARALWAPLARGRDPLYRTKATLAMTRLLADAGVLEPRAAIDHLEHIRYLWRGDGLEAGVLFQLGQMYFGAGEHIKGLTLMRRAAEITPGTAFARRVVEEMDTAFAGLFGDRDALARLSPMEAAALYDQFGELVPAGPQGDALMRNLADHLVAAGLYERGAALLEQQVVHRLSGQEARDAGLRLAAIRLLGAEPGKALETLERVEAQCARAARCEREIAFLRARALSQEGKPDAALDILRAHHAGPAGDSGSWDADAARLHADIAWRAGYWGEAAEALQRLLHIMGAGPAEPMRPEWADIVLRRALALRLAGDRAALAQWGASWRASMRGLPAEPVFAVITSGDPSPDQLGGSSLGAADAQRWQAAVAGVDLFGAFLDRYAAAPPGPLPAPLPAPLPVE